MKLLSFVLAAIAAAVFALGIAVNFVGGRFVAGFAPVTLWRFSMACLGFAIYLHLFAGDRRRPADRTESDSLAECPPSDKERHPDDE